MPRVGKRELAALGIDLAQYDGNDGDVRVHRSGRIVSKSPSTRAKPAAAKSTTKKTESKTTKPTKSNELTPSGSGSSKPERPEAATNKDQSTRPAGAQHELKDHPQITRAQQESLESKCIFWVSVNLQVIDDSHTESREKLPRFLFRAFSPKSGGGFEGLNSDEGITPHAFLKGKVPTNMYEIPNLKEEINGHLVGRKIETHFSSWAACFSFVARLTQSAGDDASIAILDTNLLEDHVKIHHVLELHSVGLSRSADSHEYLAYGPISGDAYCCVAWKHVRAAVKTSRAYMGHIRPGHLAYVSHVADLFRREDDKRPDVVIALTVMLLGLGTRHWDVSEEPNEFRTDMEAIMDGLSDDIDEYELPDSTTGAVGLSNPRTFTTGYPLLGQALRMLLAIEHHVKSAKKSSEEKGQQDEDSERSSVRD